jgi:hypothetical protein
VISTIEEEVRAWQSPLESTAKRVEIAPFGWLSRQDGGSDAAYASDLADAGYGVGFQSVGKRVMVVRRTS